MHTVGTGYRLSHDRAHGHPDHATAHPLLDRLRQTHILPQHQGRTPPFAGPLRVAVCPPDGLFIGFPAITDLTHTGLSQVHWRVRRATSGASSSSVGPEGRTTTERLTRS